MLWLFTTIYKKSSSKKDWVLFEDLYIDGFFKLIKESAFLGNNILKSDRIISTETKIKEIRMTER